MSQSWFAPYKPKNFDGFGEDQETYWWQRNHHFEIGDILYLYCGSPMSRITYKCRVDDTDCYTDDDEEPLIKLTMLFHFQYDGQLSLENLKKNGLTTIQCTNRINNQLLEYLLAVEEMQSDEEKYNRWLQSLPIDQLNRLAEEYVSESTDYQTINVKRYHRSELVAKSVKRRANGICQLCGNKAPFFDEDGQPYLEAHHIVWLSKGGKDCVKNMVALCPNCHRKMHIVDDENDVKKLQAIAKL